MPGIPLGDPKGTVSIDGATYKPVLKSALKAYVLLGI
jgi:hypothetical protein